MAIRTSVVVCITSFLLGALFTHWIADSLTLWKSPVTDEHLWTAAKYYSILSKTPQESILALCGAVGVGALTIIWSLRDGEAGNLMFDGSSLFLYATAVVVYVNSAIPTLRSKFTSIPSHELAAACPPAIKRAALELASNHLMCSVALTGVLVLQAGRHWAERSESGRTPAVQKP